ncbi:MAG: tRNA (cytidine(34)-2'-O)-methyltransferase [Alphaproteobacteria bacterium]|nr:tRNA (cytidine(34)-2'-O)-methyltransferase [Alphaproteobacteria bacterium]MDE2336470.1 tRNA (cytidine(34)-2'-O)-methyltransferase [Alphaproteobacteria bacterium]
MRLALFEPDIPQNAGTLMRLCVCMGVPMDIVEPCGFVLSDKNLKRAGMDYLERLDLMRHMNWEAFKAAQAGKRLVLLTTKADSSYIDFEFRPDDVLVAGRESAGVPEHVHRECAARVTVPMRAGLRSINVALASAMVLGEALRQTKGFPA